MEGAFRLLLEEDPLLWQRAKDNGVLIVSQMTLVIVLNMIQMTWRQYEQQQNIAKVYQTAGELLSKIEDWLSAYEGIGESLQQAQKSYDEATKALKSSDRSVIKKIGKLQELGITPKKRKTKLKKGGDALAPLTVIPKSLSAEDDEPSEE